LAAALPRGGAECDAPGMLRAAESRVPLSLALRAAREVPLQQLATEYESVLARRLARAGGGPADKQALQQLLSSFTNAETLPAAALAGGNRGSSSSSGSGERGGRPPAVARGAVIVFERDGAGRVSARVRHSAVRAGALQQQWQQKWQQQWQKQCDGM
jgi:hypothetical protein